MNTFKKRNTSLNLYEIWSEKWICISLSYNKHLTMRNQTRSLQRADMIRIKNNGLFLNLCLEAKSKCSLSKKIMIETE